MAAAAAACRSVLRAAAAAAAAGAASARRSSGSATFDALGHTNRSRGRADPGVHSAAADAASSRPRVASATALSQPRRRRRHATRATVGRAPGVAISLTSGPVPSRARDPAQAAARAASQACVSEGASHGQPCGRRCRAARAAVTPARRGAGSARDGSEGAPSLLWPGEQERGPQGDDLGPLTLAVAVAPGTNPRPS